MTGEYDAELTARTLGPMTMHQRLELAAQILVSSGHEMLARDVREASDQLAELANTVRR